MWIDGAGSRPMGGRKYCRPSACCPIDPKNKKDTAAEILKSDCGCSMALVAAHLLNNAAPLVIKTKQDKKTEIYKVIVEQMAEARPGVIELMEEALARSDVALCICSAATKAGFEKARPRARVWMGAAATRSCVANMLRCKRTQARPQVVNSVVKPARLARFDLILAGDDVANKKPHPEIYDTARSRLGLAPERCLVIEDSMARACLPLLLLHCFFVFSLAFCVRGAARCAP